jgi:hypothetical protein
MSFLISSYAAYDPIYTFPFDSMSEEKAIDKLLNDEVDAVILSPDSSRHLFPGRVDTIVSSNSNQTARATQNSINGVDEVIKFQLFPFSLYSIVPTFSLPSSLLNNITTENQAKLFLDIESLAQIYLGNISRFDDPRIQRINQHIPNITALFIATNTSLSITLVLHCTPADSQLNKYVVHQQDNLITSAVPENTTDTSSSPTPKSAESRDSVR